MATANKSERKKLIQTQVVDGVVIFQRADTGEEFTRLDTEGLDPAILEQLVVYGAKQVISDVVASLEGLDAKMEGMQKAVASLENGAWPKRTSEVSIDKAAETLAAKLGISVEALKKQLGV